MRKLIKIGLIVYISLILGIVFILLEESKNSNNEDSGLRPEKEIEPIADSAIDTDCSRHGFCVGDRVELNNNATRAGMYPINGTIMKITDGKILTIQNGSTGNEDWTILSEDWVQHIKPKDMNESNNTKVQETAIIDEG